jgi:ankyrin repeat protein
MDSSLSLGLVREFVIAGHGDLPKIKQMLQEHPGILNASYEWSPGDTETALQAAAHMGNPAVAEYLLEQGAPLDICTAAMLGYLDDVERFILDDPRSIQSTGAHGIPLLPHAALSGDVELVKLLVGRGARDGISFALGNAVSNGHIALSRWLLENEKPDLGWRNFEGKTLLQIANERHQEEIAQMLLARGAT